MELLLILIYVSICFVIFKVFKIPVNQWSLATAALGGFGLQKATRELSRVAFEEELPDCS